MKAKYEGPHADNWYGMTLTTGESYEIPDHLQDKVKASPNWKTSARKKAAKRADKS